MKPQHTSLLLGFILLILAGYFVGPFSDPIVADQSNQEHGELFQVVKVVDGDTLSVNLNGKSETIRLIGLNTPETVDPRKKVECFGKQASDKAKELLSGKRVKIEYDETQGVRDKYQRLLGYVFLEDGTHFNKVMIEEGYGYEYIYNTPYKYQKEFRAAQEQARSQKRGLWADDACSSATPSTEVEPISSSTVNAASMCSYNTYNCSDFSTQKEAQTVFMTCGGVSNDVHQLDSDNDGLVCESVLD